MNVEEIFVSFIATEQLTLSNNEALVNSCIKKIKDNGDDNQCYIKYEESTNEEYSELFPTIQNIINALSNHYELNKLQITNAWINLDNSKSITGAHNHSESILSGVYYASAGEGSGNLEFMSPVSASSYTFRPGSRKNMNRFNSDSWTVTPETGKLIIFPSWLYHYVRLNTDNTNRISIAFNANFVDTFN
jgi:uncharacterized protein (TIGR02466 family)